MLDADVVGRARAAFDVALTLGAETAHAPLGMALANALQREGTSEFAAEVETLIPEQTVSLRELAVWATDRLLRKLPTRPDDTDQLTERARLLNNLGNRLSKLGRREEALRATQEAVDCYTTLTEQLPDAHAQNFRTSVRSLLERLQQLELDPRDDPTYQRATEVARRLELNLE